MTLLHFHLENKIQLLNSNANRHDFYDNTVDQDEPFSMQSALLVANLQLQSHNDSECQTTGHLSYYHPSLISHPNCWTIATIPKPPRNHKYYTRIGYLYNAISLWSDINRSYLIHRYEYTQKQFDLKIVYWIDFSGSKCNCKMGSVCVAGKHESKISYIKKLEK